MFIDVSRSLNLYFGTQYQISVIVPSFEDLAKARKLLRLSFSTKLEAKSLEKKQKDDVFETLLHIPNKTQSRLKTRPINVKCIYTTAWIIKYSMKQSPSS